MFIFMHVDMNAQQNKPRRHHQATAKSIVSGNYSKYGIAKQITIAKEKQGYRKIERIGDSELMSKNSFFVPRINRNHERASYQSIIRSHQQLKNTYEKKHTPDNNMRLRSRVMAYENNHNLSSKNKVVIKNNLVLPVLSSTFFNSLWKDGRWGLFNGHATINPIVFLPARIKYQPQDFLNLKTYVGNTPDVLNNYDQTRYIYNYNHPLERDFTSPNSLIRNRNWRIWP